ncbi:MAG: hypothetical protein AB7I27_04325 [Bacteriovoracaceae bacterium]
MRLILFLFIFVGCSGYRFTQQDNPLAQYGVQSLSVPMFYNYSNLPDVSGDFTRETYRLLTGFSGLKLISGYDQNADAVLIGIIKTPEKVAETLRPMNLIVASGRAKNAVENREFQGKKRGSFYIPGASDMSLSLQVVLIKKPSEEELALLKSGIGDQINFNSKILLNETLPLRTTYTHEVLDDQGVDVIGTQNAGIQRKTLKGLAEQAAISVRDMILYAF